MKKLKLFCVAFMFFGVFNQAIAQEEVTDEDLRRYALLIEVVDAMKSEIKNLTISMVENQEGIEPARFNELNKANGDEAKLTAAGATDFEKKFMALVQKKKTERTTAIQDAVKIMASKMFTGGAAKYKAVKSGIKSDESVKERYNAILAKMKAAEEEA
ncbi:MAG: hypothetical protein AAFN93_03880 [Bacteroidota bacterium]